LKILTIKPFRGRNVYCQKPVIQMEIELESGEDEPTTQRPCFNEALLEALPGLKKHTCSLGREGGFAKRLQEGTYLPHVAEHVILEMQYALGYDVTFGKTRRRDDLCYHIVFRYENEAVAYGCARAAVLQLKKLWNGEKENFAEDFKALRCLAAQTDPGPSTLAILREAARRGIPATRLGDGSLIQLGYGRYARRVQASLTDSPSCIAVDVVSDKQLTKETLSALGIPVPDGAIAHSAEETQHLAEEIGYPVVVKPLDGNHGSGVSVCLRSAAQVTEAFERALQHSAAIVVERYIEGRDYRVLVVGGRVSAVSERLPAQVVGDGLHTIRSLVEIENKNPLRGEGHAKPLTRIALDETAVRHLREGGLSPSSVPDAGTRVLLRRNANLSTGGTAKAIEHIHPKNADFAIRAARALGLDVAGIDICAKDIAIPLTDSGGAILEVNAAPGLRMHLAPSEGRPVNVAKDILNMLFPEGTPHSAPIVSVTGTNGKTTTVRLIAHALRRSGFSVGMTTTGGIFVNETLIAPGDNTGALSARALLSHPNVEAAVLETARGGIVRKGLGYDLADVAVVTNVSDDHLGQDGLETIEDIAHVKALVVEAVKPNGWAVLNADDPEVGYFAERVECGILYFAKSAENPRVREHLSKAGRAVCLKGDKITAFQSKNSARPIVDIREIPITYGGAATCNIENAMAATAALVALNISDSVIRMALTTFQPNDRDNPGRFNIFQVNGCKVMLDYGHNVAGYEQVIRFLEGQGAKRLVGVIGVPGDRRDDAILKVGALCGSHFDRIIVKEDKDLRGRAPGEVANILKSAAERSKAGAVDVVLSERDALKKAIEEASEGDFITVFFEKYEPLRSLIQEFAGELSPI
jgi:cyanophycin synthetase